MSGPGWLRGASAARLLLAATSVALTLAAAEMVLRVARPQVFDVHPRGMYVADPHVGYVFTPGFTGRIDRPEFSHLFHINGLSMRGPEPRPKQTNTVRILSLGDSFTWGFGVNEGEEFTTRLEEHLSSRFPTIDVQVLNAGVPGYGTADQLRFLESRGALLQPDLIVVQFLPDNDFMENRTPAREGLEIRDGWLIAKPGDLDPARVQPAWVRASHAVKRQSHLASFVSERAGYLAMRTGLVPMRALTRGDDFSEEDEALAVHLLRRIAAVGYELGAPSIFMFSPGQAPVVAADPATAPRAADVVARAAREAGAAYLDLTPLLRGHADRLSLYFPIDGHWTAGGHGAVAEVLASFIEERGLLAGRTDNQGEGSAILRFVPREPPTPTGDPAEAH